MKKSDLTSFDIYGHKPLDIESFGTKFGLLLSTLSFVIVISSCAYVCYEYFDSPFIVADSSMSYDPDINLSPNSDVRFPDVGVTFRLKNESVFDTVNYNYILDIQFWQKYIYKSEDEYISKTIRIPTEKCLFEDEANNDQFSIAYCPQFGITEEYIDENGITITKFISTNGSRESATVPELQAAPGDLIFSSLEARIKLNLTSLDIDGPNLELDLDDFFSGDVLYIIATSTYVIDEVKVNSKLKKQYNIHNRRTEIKKYVQAKFDIGFSLRTISKVNALLDFNILSETYYDAILSEIVQELDDPSYIQDIFLLKNATNLLDIYFDVVTGTYYNESIPEIITLTSAFYHIATDSVVIGLTPKATAFDVFGIIGGFISLFSLIFGYPALLINSYLYNRALKKAKKDGKMPTEYLGDDGKIRFDRVNEAILYLKQLKKESTIFNTIIRHLKKRTRKVNKKVKFSKPEGNSTSGIIEEI